MVSVTLSKEENKRLADILEQLSAREPTHDGRDSQQAWIAHMAIANIYGGGCKE